jgi:hypothetical protein
MTSRPTLESAPRSIPRPSGRPEGGASAYMYDQPQCETRTSGGDALELRIRCNRALATTSALLSDMDQLTYGTLASRLLDAVPELKSRYEAELRWWGEERPGPHIVYGDVLMPYLIPLLEAQGGAQTLERIFAFLELLARNEDLHVQEVLQMTVLERLGDSRQWLDRAREFMGERTLQLSHEIEGFWGRGD